MDIDDLKNRMSRKFRGASLDDIQGVENFSVFEEAAGNLLSHVDPYETVRTHRFNVFEGVYDYSPPSDLKGKKLIDPRPQDGRMGEDFQQTYTKEFDRDKESWRCTIEYLDGSKVMRLTATGKGSKTVDQTAATTEWTAAGGASGLVVDSVLRLDNSDTLRVDLGAAGGYIEAGVAAAMTQIDLSDDEDISSFFRKIYLPDASLVTSITLLIGSASGAYWSIAGQAHFGSYRDGVNLVRFDWDDAVETDAPDSSIVDYERLTFVTTAALASVRIGPLMSKIPYPYETPYYSNRLFRDTAGAWLESPTATTDEVVLEKEAENIFFYECCQLVAEDLQLDQEAVKFRKHLGIDEQGNLTGGGLYGDYRTAKPGEALRPHTQYYRARRGISQRNGRGIVRE